jgi:hypothetical protein
MKGRVALGVFLLVLVSCGDDGGDPNGTAAGAPARSGSGGNTSGAGGVSSGGSDSLAGSGGQSGAGRGGAAAGANTQGGAGGGGASGGAGAGATPGGASGASTAGNGGSGGEAVVNPTLTALEPSTLPFGSGAFELVLRGTNLRADHMVAFDGNVFPTTFVSADELRADVPGAALGGRARSVNVLASRIADPALRTNVLMFEITAP